MTTEPGFPFHVEALAASHDRTGFHSGVPELDRYLYHQAGQDARRKVAAPFVLVDGTGCMVGYYTFSAYGIRLGELPEAMAKKLPRYPLLPATLLGRLAIHSSCRGRNLGQFLVMDVLHRSWKNTSEIASIGVIAEAPCDAARAFYLHHEFVQLQDHPNRLFLAMATIEKAFKSA